MYGLLADHNCAGQLQVLLRICRSARWRTIWSELLVRLCTFESLGLETNLPDSAIWDICQKENLFLVTANRNSDGADSLQATINLRGTVESLPVLTLGDADAILEQPDYAERAAARLMEILIAPQEFKGTGRLYLPSTAEESEELDT